MAYMSQEKKKKIAPVVKAICKRHGVKASLSVRHHSTLVVSISEGRIDFFADRVDSRWHGDFADPKVAEERLAKDRERGYFDVNPYSWREHFKGAALAFLEELFPALNDGNHDRSDPMTDYFDVGWYVDVDVGRWNKPYKLNPVIPALPALALERAPAPAPIAKEPVPDAAPAPLSPSGGGYAVAFAPDPRAAFAAKMREAEELEAEPEERICSGCHARYAYRKERMPGMGDYEVRSEIHEPGCAEFAKLPTLGDLVDRGVIRPVPEPERPARRAVVIVPAMWVQRPSKA